MSETRCQVCNSEQQLEIEYGIRRGVALKDLSSQFSVSAFSLSRHRAKHLNQPTQSAEPSDDLDAQLWLNRAHEIWDTASADGDTRGMADAVRTALRGVELQRKSEKREVEKQESPQQSFTLEYLDELMQRHYAQVEQDQRYRVAMRLQANASDRQIEVIEILLNDEAWFREIETLAKRKVTNDFE